MILGECFEKFIDRSPVSVMVRGTLERVFDPEKLERVFTDNALLQYTRELTFAQCVGLMSEVVFRITPRVGAWYKAHQEAPAAYVIRETVRRLSVRRLTLCFTFHLAEAGFHGKPLGHTFSSPDSLGDF